MSMDWSNERYVRFYTRDTVTWKRWTWEARSCWGLLLRKVDRSGLLDTGDSEKVDALALMLDIPCEVAHRVVPQWLACGSLMERASGFSVPTFLAAQEAKQSDKLRQSESRANRLAASLRNDETACHTASQHVTDCHTVSHGVTPAVPSLAVPSQPLKTAPADAVAPFELLLGIAVTPVPKVKAPRESDALCADFTEIIGQPYRWQDAKDGAAFASLRKMASLDEIRARWRAGLASSDKWLSVRTVAQLSSKWNDLSALRSKEHPAIAKCVNCGAAGPSGWPDLGVPTCHPCAGAVMQFCEENNLVPYVDGATRWLESQRRAS